MMDTNELLQRLRHEQARYAENVAEIDTVQKKIAEVQRHRETVIREYLVTSNLLGSATWTYAGISQSLIDGSGTDGTLLIDCHQPTSQWRRAIESLASDGWYHWSFYLDEHEQVKLMGDDGSYRLRIDTHDGVAFIRDWLHRLGITIDTASFERRIKTARRDQNILESLIAKLEEL
jgi:hypothetical protein